MTKQAENASTKILVVEDSRTQAEYLCHILKSNGYEVGLAVNGNDALAQVRIEHPAMVLTDILMPEMDGYALCRAIKQDPDLASIPVILVTQLFDPADLIKGLEAGANNIIIKPFEPEHVISRITGTLQSLAQAGSDDEEASLEVSLAGKKHLIPANRLRTPAILLSTYDHALKNNAELQEAQKRLTALNGDLQQKVEELQEAYNTILKEKNERIRAEEALKRENKKLHMMAGLTRDTLLNQLLALQKCLEQADTFRDNEPILAWEQITKAELVLGQTIKTLR